MRQFELLEKLEKRGGAMSPVFAKNNSFLDSSIKNLDVGGDFMKKSLLFSRQTSRAGSP